MVVVKYYAYFTDKASETGRLGDSPGSHRKSLAEQEVELSS